MVEGTDRRGVLIGGASALLLSGQRSAPRPKIELWNNATGPHLRGAVLPQRRVYPEIDGVTFLGPGPVGAPVSDSSLHELADAGANLVVLSCPGLFRESEPFEPDPQIANWLVALVDRCTAQGLFTVIGFRTGPGRSEFTFHRDNPDDWFPAFMIDERVWQAPEMQRAWADMWRYTARLFAGHQGVAGYVPMVEPNASHIRSQFDWPRFALRLAAAIRDEDSTTPILISPDGYANRSFASELPLETVPNAVLFLHDYTPYDYTHAGPENSATLNLQDAEIAPPAARRWAVGEFGVRRWVPQADRFLDVRLRSLEASGANSAIFHWPSGWHEYERVENAWNPLLGSDPANSSRLADAPILAVLRQHWSRNTIRP
ncbi:glycoside hydrolase family 5 protein [Hyphobacterium sp.]|uniref:glycoside hydrolase family 5 protein n=1 Tax=Hyphobacterium sp. TaxID=2004662 RepID=UPI003B515EE6